MFCVCGDGDVDDDGIVYPVTFNIRIPAILENVSNQTDSETYIGFNNEAKNVKAISRKIYNIQFDFVPLYYAETMMLAFGKTSLVVNGQSMTLFESPTFEWIEKTNLYKFSVKTTDSSYEDYSSISSLATEGGTLTTGTYWSSSDTGIAVFQDNSNHIAIIN